MTATAAVVLPEKGQLVVVRDRHWIVSEVQKGTMPLDELSSSESGHQHLVSLISVEDDGSNDDLDVIWEVEPGCSIRDTATLPEPVEDRFDDPAELSAFLDAIRWGAVASADASSLQSPFRSGIQIEDYQLEPVVRALRMPRVNLLVADDVGLGKTIEAGLVIQELLLRHRARTVFIACPASLCVKWQEEMIDKFGLDFEIIDSAKLKELRRSRGVGVNPFRVFPRVIVSIDWLKTTKALGLLREVLPADSHTYPRRFDLLVIDEIHQCAPPGRGKYAIDSLRTRVIREIAPHFEHRLFLSATPHNGYTESFTALLELLDPQRFTRGVQPKTETLGSVIVRRLKPDILKADGTPRFPKRVISPVEIDFPDDEREVHAWLNKYAALRKKQAMAKGSEGTSDLITLLLKKRLFSSPAAFHSTLQVHVRTLDSQSKKRTESEVGELFDRLGEDFDDDDAAAMAEEEALAAAATATDSLTAEQRELVDNMMVWADSHRAKPDAKTQRLLDWLIETCCPSKSGKNRVWNDERVIIFTEYRATQIYLQELLEARGLGGDRLSLIYGGMDSESRELIKSEFQHDPALRPVRILLATDAASEGIDLQRHCYRLVHVEIPFSPTKLEQRNGRVDRHGQTAPEVLIHHFVPKGWENADYSSWNGVAGDSLEADLAFLYLIAKKTDTIRDDLGSVGPVLGDEVEKAMLGKRANPNADGSKDRNNAARILNKLERDYRKRTEELRQTLDQSIAELHLAPENVERVVQAGLELANQPSLVPTSVARKSGDISAFVVPRLTRSWASATRDLYDPIADVVRPITFDHDAAADHDDVVLAHLNHRLVAQAMRTLRAEIWSSGSEVRMSRVTAREASPHQTELVVVAHARLVLVGGDGRRLHEEIITAGGRVNDKGSFSRWSKKELTEALDNASLDPVSGGVQSSIVKLWSKVSSPVFSSLEVRATERTEALTNALENRRLSDIDGITDVLKGLEETIKAELIRIQEEDFGQLTFDFAKDEREQLDRDLEAWQRRLDEIPEEIDREIAAINDRYATPFPRLFPAAIEFLVPKGWM